MRFDDHGRPVSWRDELAEVDAELAGRAHNEAAAGRLMFASYARVVGERDRARALAVALEEELYRIGGCDGAA